MLLGCYSPTLPLPPPSPPDESAGTEPQTIILTGGPGSVEANSLVLIQNMDTATFNKNQQVTGTIANADGSWGPTTVPAIKNDVLIISYTVGDTESQSIDFVVN